MIGPGRSGREDSEFRRFHYPGTETLINLLGIRDPKRLEVAKHRLVRTRLREGLPRATDPRTYPGFMTIHHHLFQDVFGWAGQERTYTTGRGPAPFATPENIRPWMEKQFALLRQQHFLRGLVNSRRCPSCRCHRERDQRRSPLHRWQRTHSTGLAARHRRAGRAQADTPIIRP